MSTEFTYQPDPAIVALGRTIARCTRRRKAPVQLLPLLSQLNGRFGPDIWRGLNGYSKDDRECQRMARLDKARLL